MAFTRRDFLKTGAGLGSMAMMEKSFSETPAQSIIMKTIPSTGEPIPVIGFGTNRYGSGSDPAVRNTLTQVLNIFHSKGGKLLDSSSHYKGSEAVLGNILNDLNLTNQILFSTKAGKFDEGLIEEKFSRSFENLQVDQLDFYAIHNAADQDWENMLPKIREWKQEGKIRYLGVTTSEPEEYEEVAKILRTQTLDFIQLNYNLSDRHAEKLLIPMAAEKGLAIIGNVPFAQGALFSAVKGIELPDFAKDFSHSWGSFFLKYIISHPQITSSIPGTTKPQHAIDNMHAGMGRLPSLSERKKQEAFLLSL